PVVTVSCQPASEQAIAKAVGQVGVTTRHVCGKNDLLLSWTNKIEFSELAKFVSTFRTDWDASNLVMRTTTYLETPVGERQEEKYAGISSSYEFIDAEEEKTLFESLGRVQPHSLRAGLSDLALRLSACLRSP